MTGFIYICFEFFLNTYLKFKYFFNFAKHLWSVSDALLQLSIILSFSCNPLLFIVLICFLGQGILLDITLGRGLLNHIFKSFLRRKAFFCAVFFLFYSRRNSLNLYFNLDNFFPKLFSHQSFDVKTYFLWLKERNYSRLIKVFSRYFPNNQLIEIPFLFLDW